MCVRRPPFSQGVKSAHYCIAVIDLDTDMDQAIEASIRGRVGSDGTTRLLNAGGPPGTVADYLREFEALGIDEVIWIFRNPFDLETMAQLGEVDHRPLPELGEIDLILNHVLGP